MSVVEAVIGISDYVFIVLFVTFIIPAADICKRIRKIVRDHYPYGLNWVYCSRKHYWIAVDVNPPATGNNWAGIMEITIPKWKVRRAFFTGRLRKLIETELAIQMLKGEL